MKSFLYELDQDLLKKEMYKDHNDKFSAFANEFRYVLDKHVPLKTKTIRGNNAPFMIKKLSKEIMNRSRLRSKYLKWPSRENVLENKKAKTICNSLNKSSKKTYFAGISRKGFVSNKKFWSKLEPFLINKGFLTNENIAVKCNEQTNIPIFKKNEREKVENYRPASILNCFSKICEKYILKQFKTFLNDFPSTWQHIEYTTVQAMF